MKINTKQKQRETQKRKRKNVDGIYRENSITEMVTTLYHFEIIVEDAAHDSTPTSLGNRNITDVLQVN